ncbi:polyphosphate kinase 2 family protein [Mucilaginibacter sp. RS28]|uniref:Polyphosphate kinase 2 family protein n=1 Tax=Mucilaginibacter straminoryzae TaxID=2932774 RepID=A0A9X1X6Q9_9SPHI|nr:polyphosphate kinase 2 family protein [Mucilaginibacter straminoryzae]MCJ8211165.1 polyphosphate kinase 2 family protein [Mucilaginibacter straminoryzae]
MKNITDEFKVTDGEKFNLEDYHTDYTGSYKKEDAESLLQSLIKETAKLQEKLYASNQHAVLIIFQAMDAAGKDSAIAHTMSGLNPQACQVYSFKQPSAEEYDHDFLWRHYKALPERGRFGIHNRSHYENVLVTKVHPEYIMNEHLPGINSPDDLKHDFWEKRYKSIRDFESHLCRTGTVIIKFFLHVSKEEQKERFLKRLEDPEKNWKFSASDITERQLWHKYMQAYQDAIRATSAPHAPWYVIPADKKWFTRIAISTIILETLQQLDLKRPVLPVEQAGKFAEIKRMLEEE